MSEPQTTRYDYLRVRIEVLLCLLSPLHCGDGDELPADRWKGREPLGAQGHINTTCMGHQGAYIPGSTLRGSLRERCAAPLRLFGEARGAAGRAGAVRAYDAVRKESDPATPDTEVPGPAGDLYWNPSRRTTLRNGVALDPVTGTAQDGKLFTFEVVPTGQVFRCVLEADRITVAELDELLTLVMGWDGSAASALGRGRSRGWGRVCLEGAPTVLVLTGAALTTWATGAATVLPKTGAALTTWATGAATVLPNQDAPREPPPLGAPPLAPTYDTPPRTPALQFRLEPTGPLLVNDAGRVLGRKNVKGKDPLPHLEFMRTADQAALIPGSSLRGALRAQAGRILATIAHQHYEASAQTAREGVEPLLTALFGTERRRSLLWVGDAIALHTREHPQTFSAVDRFTGAVAQETQKIYSVAAADCPTLCGTVALDPDPAGRRLPKGDWWKGLLLLLLRDLYEDDLILGWGKTRGYGAVRLTLQGPDAGALADFNAVLAAVREHSGATAPQTWLRALHEAVNALNLNKTQGNAA